MCRHPRFDAHCDGTVSHSITVAADASLAERPIGIAEEEAAHDRFGMAVCRAPVIEALGLGEMNEPDVRGRERVTHEIDRGLLRIPKADPTSQSSYRNSASGYL